ncbi:MAG TPA: ABC transporter permease [Gaiellaceae bacterium]|nr:ABC transporter permease [Gaiellaceae bacterium]
MEAAEIRFGGEPGRVPRRGPWRQAFGRLRRRPLALAAGAVVGFFVLVALLAPVVAPYAAGWSSLQLIQKPQAPLAPHHLLGTDVLGHDLLTQLLYAVRETMLSAFFCAGLATIIGGTVGVIAGYSGGWFDGTAAFVMRVAVSLPAILVLGFVSSRYPGLLTPLQNAFWLALILWPGVARIVSTSVASLRSREFVQAARAAGASTPRVVSRHVLPNVTGTLIVAATTLVGQAIVIVATVQYLGYSANDAHQPTLGGLVADATAAPSQVLSGTAGIGDLWWLYTFPAAVLVVLLLAVTFLGDSLDEALNPAR